MGTPAFAVPSLQALAASDHEILAVVTNPDRAAGRGRRLRPPQVKEAADKLGLPVLQPASVRDPDLWTRLNHLRPDLFVVVAFSILPAGLLGIPRLGSVNLHPSLLPQYRGAAPIVWALFDGVSETGVTTFLLNQRVDAGDIVIQETVSVGVEETAGELEGRLSRHGAQLVVRSLDGLADGSVVPTPQPRTSTTHAPKLTKEDGRLDWNWDAERLRNRIRGANPMPGAFTDWREGTLKIHRARTVLDSTSGEPGTVVTADVRKGLIIATGTDALQLLEVQPEGKAKMTAQAFVTGYSIEVGIAVGDESAT